MELQYQLNKEEIEESLLCTNWKREGWWKRANILILTAVGIICIVLFARNPKNPVFPLLTVLICLLLFYISYGTALYRKHKANQICRQRGIYKIQVPEQDIQNLYRSEHVITIEQKDALYCVPRRILDSESNKYMEELIEKHRECFIEINIQRGKVS